MKLETKLGLSTGILVSAMLLSSMTAHRRISEANRVSQLVATRQVPLILLMREVAMNLAESTQTLESYMLFGVDAARSSEFR